jgi:hypothetical protein
LRQLDRDFDARQWPQFQICVPCMAAKSDGTANPQAVSTLKPYNSRTGTVSRKIKRVYALVDLDFYLMSLCV